MSVMRFFVTAATIALLQVLCARTVVALHSTYPTAAEVSYQFPTGPQVHPAMKSTVANALSRQGPSVLDFGAKAFRENEDQTSAFVNALASSADWPITVHVPEGRYYLSGTVDLYSGKTLILAAGAELVRMNCTNGDAPLIRLTSTSATLLGYRGAVSTLCLEVPHSQGLVQLGPKNESAQPLNIEWNLITGIEVRGNGVRGSVGILCDSTEPFVGGSCYQNTIRDVLVSNVDVGVLALKYVNANTFTNLNFLGIGKYAIQFVNNSENQVHGLFTSGSQNISYVIGGFGSFYNSFTNIQSEPGGGGLFYFDEHGERNSVIGHDNCPHGSISKDPAFTWVDGGRAIFGNFTDSYFKYFYALDVEGKGYIQSLDHGLPRVGRHSASKAVGKQDSSSSATPTTPTTTMMTTSTVEEGAPLVSDDLTTDRFQICSLGFPSASATVGRRHGHYDLVVSGMAVVQRSARSDDSEEETIAFSSSVRVVVADSGRKTLTTEARPTFKVSRADHSGTTSSEHVVATFDSEVSANHCLGLQFTVTSKGNNNKNTAEQKFKLLDRSFVVDIRSVSTGKMSPPKSSRGGAKKEGADIKLPIELQHPTLHPDGR